MDFDPGFFSEDDMHDSYEEGYEDGHESDAEDDDVVETDELGNPIYLAAAAGFGYHMAQDEIEERRLAEEILKKREGKKDEPVKVPLKTRHAGPKGTPFQRWAARVNQDPKSTKEPLTYTEEEQNIILKHEAEGWPDYD